MSKQAHILCLRADTIAMDLGFGVRPYDAAARQAVLSAQAWLGPRPVLEEDRSFLQIIPYVALRRGGEVLAYVRGADGGEARLLGKDSIGLGGHVDLPDVVVDQGLISEKGKMIPANRIDVEKTVLVNVLRELHEECGIEIERRQVEADPDLLRFTHLIHVDEGVNAVHLGLVAVIDLDRLGSSGEMRYEDVIENAVFAPIAELAAGRIGERQFSPETWSELLLLTILVEERSEA